MSDDQAYGIAAGELRQFIEQYEQLEAEKKDVTEQQKEREERFDLLPGIFPVFNLGVKGCGVRLHGCDGNFRMSGCAVFRGGVFFRRTGLLFLHISLEVHGVVSR